ncbi:MAG: AAA family ATPase, partial [Verrucomicrobiales bacterium]|nr:AAA family ATPase [Verrucomicrobiales bacterium]
MPLAARMRPRDLSEYVGQGHILGEGKLLRRAVEADRFTSLIFYGPPGVGKTSLAELIARRTESRFINLSGVESNVA